MSRIRNATVAASLVADLLGYLRAQGVDPDQVCRRAGIDPRTVLQASNRIPGHVMNALWREGIAATSDADLALHAGMTFQPGALDIVGYVMLSSHTASDAIRRGARLMQLLNDGLAVEVERAATTTTCRVRLLDVEDNYVRNEPRHAIETLLAGLVYQLRLLTERNVVPLEVRMRHAKPVTGAAEHARLFGVAPVFGAEHDLVVLNNNDLDIQLRSANPMLLSAFEAHADATLAALNVRDTLSGRVLREIVDRLKGEAPTIQHVAKALAMSARNLQRGLSGEGTTFQTLLDDARRELAVRHLAVPDATVAKVAWLVGFSEPSAFHRAFRRWTGHSPRAMTVGAT